MPKSEKSVVSVESYKLHKPLHATTYSLNPT